MAHFYLFDVVSKNRSSAFPFLPTNACNKIAISYILAERFESWYCIWLNVSSDLIACFPFNFSFNLQYIMVGIAGKSKACHDCKRRRVKVCCRSCCLVPHNLSITITILQCDLTLPLCHRCSKAGIACRGYEQSTLWVHRTPARPNVTALSVVADARLQQQNRESSTQSNWLGLLQRMRTQLDSNESSYHTKTFRRNALSIIKSTYFPRSRVISSVADFSSTPSSWVTAVCQLQGPSDALDHSLLAFCAIQIRLSSEPGISYDETVQLYNHALSRIIALLDSPCVDNCDESLAAIVILSTCEVG